MEETLRGSAWEGESSFGSESTKLAMICKAFKLAINLSMLLATFQGYSLAS
jgi:hypothetical protein